MHGAHRLRGRRRSGASHEPGPDAVDLDRGNGTGPIEEAGCPVPDEAFWATAVEVAGALANRDADELLELSRADRIVCADVATEYFPACRYDDVLRGYGSGGPDFVIEMLDRDAYHAQLEAILGAIDPTFEDELSDGGVRLLGVGTCGPDVPERRTYHMAWTAAASEPGGPVERLLSSFELSFADDGWRIVLCYLGPLHGWEGEMTDPLENAFCEAGRSPWAEGRSAFRHHGAGQVDAADVVIG